MSFGKGTAPTPPNPIATAGAQTASNVSTAIANSFLNNTNQVTPLGSLTYNNDRNFSFNDPTTGAAYDIPGYTATQTLGPTQQATQDQSETAKLNLATLANSQSSRLNQLLGGNIDLSQLPPGGGIADLFYNLGGQGGTPAQSLAPGSRGYQMDIADPGAITKTYGPADDFSSDRGRVEQSLYGRLNPQLQIEQQHIEQQLADQGIRYGSPAYQAAMDSYSRQANDARLAVTQTAGTEQQRMMDMAAQRAGFQNAAQQQQYAQNLGKGQFANESLQAELQDQLQRGTFLNQAGQQAFGQDAAVKQFYNNAEAQLFNMRNQQRDKALAEQYALRNQPINEVSALLSGSQVQQPSFTQTPQTQIPTTDIAGLINQNFNQQFQNYQQQNTNANQLIGGLFGAAGNIGRGYYQSDRRVKKNIHRVGTVFAATPQPVEEPENMQRKKLPIYEYAYKDDPTSTTHIGPMAQDVEKVDPGAVKSFGGIKHINAGRTMGSILRAA